ncbi:TPA: hypothetical protein ACWMDD_000333 [Klebsiella quasipneumoniae]
MTTDITELALIKGQKVEAPYYLAECTECGKMYSSSKLIVSRNYFDGDADCYCPHCNADDADIADLGSGEQPAVMAWNYQQARIDVLVEALEKAQQRIAELEEAEQKLCAANVTLDARAELAERQLAELESRTVKLPKRHSMLLREDFNEDYHTEMAYKADEVHASLAAAGIKVEAEMKIRIVLQELKEDGVLTTYSNGHVEMLPYRIDENGEEYVEMFPNDIEQH